MTRTLGLDYGERRIGVAVSDEVGIIAMPLCVIHVQNRRQVLSEIQRVCREKNVEKIIVGMPINMNGTKGHSANSAVRFAEHISKYLSLPVEFWDERLSSRLAERILIDADVRRSRRKMVIDKIAAQIVLQSYLDAQI